MKRFVLYVNKIYTEEKALVEVINEDDYKIVLKGDNYHDKISEQIAGFLYGLDYCDIKYVIKYTKYLTSNDKLFSELGFVDDEED